MCGIIGCNGVGAAAPIIIEGLKRLEYRGYDSAGLAVLKSGKIRAEKKKGRVAYLEKALGHGENFCSDIGIGHTRWATHGEPSDENAHPHTCGRYTLVHNGIIENHEQLRQQYLKLCSMKSSTDSEVIVQLLNRMEKQSCLEAVAGVARMLEGSFALAILCEDEPEKLFCVRKASPLLVGIGNGTYTASDTAAIGGLIHTLYRMADCEIAVLHKDRAEFFDFELNRISKTPEPFEHGEISSDSGGYEHFMLKEIHEQPEAVRKTVESLMTKNGYNTEIDIDEPEHIYIVACGSAYHAGMVGRYIFMRLLKKPVSVETASEFRYNTPELNAHTPVIIISQSGETADSLAALRQAKSRGAKTVSVVNVSGSSIAVESDFVILTKAGPEIAVATTKAYSAQLAALYFLGIYFAEKFGSAEKSLLSRMKNQLFALDKAISRALGCEEEIKELAHSLRDTDRAYFIGRGLGYCAAAEGSLKLKEISYTHCEAYPAGEMKHGTISLIEKGTVVIAADAQPSLTAKLQSNIDEVRSRGARVIAISSQPEKIAADAAVYVPQTAELFQVSTQVVPLQLLSYHVARLKGCDIDKPRNLAKSVTVE